MNAIVNGGTGGGRFMGKKKNQLKQDWTCSVCEQSVSYYWKHSPCCGAARPKGA